MELISNLKESYMNIKSAQYILDKTYKITKNQRLLLSAVIKIYNAVLEISNHLIINDNKSIDISDLEKFDFLKKSDVAIEEELKLFLDDLFLIVSRHEESPVEFTRKDTFVICTNEYDMRKVSEKDVETFISYANLLIERVSGRVTLK